MKIEYETIKNGYITKEQAIAKAGCDRNLKDSIFREKKENDGVILGFISFHEFDVALVKFYDDFAWHVKVKSGDWGEVKTDEKGNVTMHLDGVFLDDGSISCFIKCNSGKYWYYDEIEMDKIKVPNIDEYNKYISHGSIYF